MVILPWLFCKVYLMFLQSSVMISGDVFVGDDGLSFYFFIILYNSYIFPLHTMSFFKINLS